VYYDSLAYEPWPSDARLRELINKMMRDEALSESELVELQAVRPPWADITEDGGLWREQSRHRLETELLVASC